MKETSQTPFLIHPRFNIYKNINYVNDKKNVPFIFYDDIGGLYTMNWMMSKNEFYSSQNKIYHEYGNR